MTGEKREQFTLSLALVTGIYPPDIGGPATHAQQVSEELRRRGHQVRVVTLWDGFRIGRSRDLVQFPRWWPWPFRLAAVAGWLTLHRRSYELVYAVGLHSAAAVGGRMSGRPVIAKIVGDWAWERARRRRLVTDDFERFQTKETGPSTVSAMRWIQRWSLRHVAAITTPSQYLAGVVQSWLEKPVEIHVIPNGVKVPNGAAGWQKGDDLISSRSLQLIFVGRLVDHKRVDFLLDAAAATTGVALDIVGDGPEFKRLTQRAHKLGLHDRVDFLGQLPHPSVLGRMRNADALVLTSEVEGLPHVAIEALACGIPVVSTAGGEGVSEVVDDQRSGIVLKNGSLAELVSTLEKLRDNGQLLRRLKKGARQDANRWRIESTADQLEDLLRAFQP